LNDATALKTLFLTERVTAVCGKQAEIGTIVLRTAIEAVWCSGADRRSFEASAVPILVHLFIVLMVHKYRQSAKERYILKGFWVNP